MAATAAFWCTPITGEHRGSAVAAMGSSYMRCGSAVAAMGSSYMGCGAAIAVLRGKGME